MENTEIQNEEVDPLYEEDPLEDDTTDWGDSPVKDESLQVKDYDHEKYKSAVWVNKQNITVYKARVSGPDYFEKGILRLIENIEDDYGIDEITFEPGSEHPYISWQVEGQRLQKSNVHFAQIDDEYEITVAITNISKTAAQEN